MVGVMKGITFQSNLNLHNQKEKQILILCGENNCYSISNGSNSEMNLHLPGFGFPVLYCLELKNLE